VSDIILLSSGISKPFCRQNQPKSVVDHQDVPSPPVKVHGQEILCIKCLIDNRLYFIIL